MAAKKKKPVPKTKAAPKKAVRKKSKPVQEMPVRQMQFEQPIEQKPDEIHAGSDILKRPVPIKTYIYIACSVVLLAIILSLFFIGNANVNTERSLPVKEYAKAAIGIACTDKCGDNTCAEVVCMAENCPCSENYRTCPEDCHEARFADLAEFAKDSECIEKGELTENYAFNPETRTWWINMKMKPEFAKDGCSPACVIYEDEDKIELNWRCTGLAAP